MAGASLGSSLSFLAQLQDPESGREWETLGFVFLRHLHPASVWSVSSVRT